jgi:cyclopropane fatty-acyl-phospholipid synthase-like methyltransferase
VRRRPAVLVLLLVALAGCAELRARLPSPDVVFIATPEAVGVEMLRLAAVRPHDVVFDLGSGDGRILIAAANQYGAKAVGYEISPVLVEQTRAEIRKLNLAGRVEVHEKNLFEADLSTATVVTLYLGEPNNAKLLPKLKALKPGTRIVSHQHLLGPDGPKPAQSVVFISKETGSEHRVYVWTAPLGP